MSADKLGRQYFNTELEPEEAQEFRRFLKEAGIKYEASQAFNLIHFECLVDEVDRFFVERFLRGVDYGRDL